jgi:hypothetical protein
MRHPCDLCGAPTRSPHPARPFGLVGKICGQCKRELIAERSAKPEVVSYKNPCWPDGKLYRGPHAYRLEVLNPGFTLADLTPRAMARVMVAEGRKRQRRVAS